MTTNHEAIAALPIGSNPDKALIRAMATGRFPYTLSRSENPGDFLAVDPASGVKPRYIARSGLLYELDDDDSTTGPSAVCLVTNDGKRYKADAVGIPFSVLDKDLTAQPDTPTIGDRYIIPTAATGADWAGEDGKVGEYTGRGWVFSEIPIGRSVYVRDEDARYYRNDSGVWTAGAGSQVFAANTIPITSIIGANASFVIKVENQTTNTPPSSPVSPVAYIIGSSPTGSWAGHAGDLAICLVDGSFTIVEPATGDLVYDKNLKINVQWNGTAWLSAAGAIVGYDTTGLQTSVVNTVTGSGGIYSYSNTSAPTRNHLCTREPQTLSLRARRVGNLLRFRFRCFAENASVDSGSFSATYACAALFRGDASGNYETNAVDWLPINQIGNPPPGSVERTLEVVATDTDLHNYQVGITSYTTTDTFYQVRFSRRIFSYNEYV